MHPVRIDAKSYLCKKLKQQKFENSIAEEKKKRNEKKYEFMSEMNVLKMFYGKNGFAHCFRY